MTRPFYSPHETDPRPDDFERGETPSQRDARKKRERETGRWTRSPNEGTSAADFPVGAARMRGLGADKPFEMAPFASDEERAAYWERVQRLRDEKGGGDAA